MLREIVTETSGVRPSGRAKPLSPKTKIPPCQIQVETCPAPEFNLGKKDVKLMTKTSEIRSAKISEIDFRANLPTNGTMKLSSPFMAGCSIWGR